MNWFRFLFRILFVALYLEYGFLGRMNWAWKRRWNIAIQRLSGCLYGGITECLIWQMLNVWNQWLKKYSVNNNAFRVRDSDPLGRRLAAVLYCCLLERGSVARVARGCRRHTRGALQYSPTHASGRTALNNLLFSAHGHQGGERPKKGDIKRLAIWLFASIYIFYSKQVPLRWKQASCHAFR